MAAEVPEARVESFGDALVVEPAGDGWFDATLHPAYHLWGGTFVHGGFAMAITSKAMALAAGRPDAVTLTAHFTSQVDLAPTRVRTRIVREGGRHATVAATVVQGEVECMHLLGTFGDTSRAAGPSLHRDPPDVPAWEDCLDSGFPTRFTAHLDGRLDPATARFLSGGASGSTFVQGRLRFRGDQRLDAPTLAFVSDLLVSPAIEAGVAELSWIPTVELTVHAHDTSWTGEVLARIWIDHLSDGYATEDVEVWAGDGSRLLAVGRQLALVRAPSG